jgi:hypothetical protein
VELRGTGGSRQQSSGVVVEPSMGADDGDTVGTISRSRPTKPHGLPLYGNGGSGCGWPNPFRRLRKAIDTAPPI